MLYERSGSWAVGFYGCVVMALVAAGLAVWLRGAKHAAHAAAATLPDAVPAK
jgi:hypothetical protein